MYIPLRRRRIGFGADAAQRAPFDPFWTAVERLDARERLALWRFATGSPRVPALAGARLVIDLIDPDGGRLPSASTCSRALHVPDVRDADEMLRRVRVALAWCAERFDLA